MKENGIWLLIIGCVLLGTSLRAQPQEARLEAEYKLSVPADQEEALWEFLTEKRSAEVVRYLDSSIQTVVSAEYFIDEYFDNESLVLFENQAGVRYRKRYVSDTLVKELVQIKLSFKEGDGVVRQEFKFDHYDKVKKNDRLSAYPLWKHIAPKDRSLVNLRLAKFGIEGAALTKSVKVKQFRRRVYLSKNNLPLATITLDRVTGFYFPYPAFTELELELNELLYTDADATERAKMDLLNKQLKEGILTKFPDLQQNQTPKYNKMKLMVEQNWMSTVYENYVYLVLGGLAFYALFMVYRHQILRNKKLALHTN